MQEQLLLGQFGSGGREPQFRDLRIVYKAADETRSSDATIKADAELILSNLRPNTTYVGYLWLIYSSGITPDFLMDFNATGSGSYSWDGSNPSGTLVHVNSTLPTDSASTGSTVIQILPIAIHLVTGAAIDTLTFRWAQNTSTASDTIVKAGSTMQLMQGLV